mgnify:CR=1 FL=1
MKRLLSKIASTLLALIVLISTFSFTVEKHYCGDFLIDVSYVGNANPCGEKMTSSSEVKNKSCCKDEIEHIEGQDELQKNSIEELTFDQQKVFVAIAISFQQTFENIHFKEKYFKDFPPPNLYYNYQVLHQSFLI